jgi:hypothetical protein
MFFRKIFFTFFLIAMMTNFAFAQVEVYIQKGGKEFVEKISFNENSFTDSIRINFYCSYIKLFRGDICVSDKEYNQLNNIGLTKDAPMQNLAMTESDSKNETTPATVSTPSPQVIYQVIEKAVPGPQGPAGRDGVDMTNNNSNTIASFFPNTAIGSQYIGYGSGNGGGSANPTGNGNLSSLNVSGDSSFGGKITGSGLVACNTVTDKLAYNSTTGQFECNVDQGGGFNGGNILGQIIHATTSLYAPILYASTTWASSTLASSSFVNNLIATQATFSYATVTNGFFTNLSVAGPISAALNNGFVFRGGTNNFSEATSSIFIDNSSNIGIGTSTSLSARVNVSGTVKFSSYSSAGANLITDLQGNLFISSDERLKNVQGEFSKGLAELKNIKPVYYKWNELSGLDKENIYTGFIAQNVAENIPEAVSVGGNGYLSLADRPIIASLINAVKELSDNLESYISRLVNLENKHAELENKVNTLQQRLDTLQGVSPAPAETNNWVDTNATGTASTTATTTETLEENGNPPPLEQATNTVAEVQ